jgi:hypothetical protein
VVDDGGVVPNYFMVGLGSKVLVEEGGSMGHAVEAVGAEVTIAGGTIGGAFRAFIDSKVTISGGYVGDFLHAFQGSVVSISGGTVGGYLIAYEGSTVLISGGTIGHEFHADAGSKVNISGGIVGDGFWADHDSEIHLIGKEFYLDGRRLEGLVNPGDSLVLETRGGRRLTGTFLDGNIFDFDLNTSTSYREDGFHPNAILRLTLPLLLPGDFDFDGKVDEGDLAVWKRDYGLAGDGLTADANGDGIVNAADYTVWRDNLGAVVQANVQVAIPEPAALALAPIAVATIAMFRWHRYRAP